MLNFISRRRVAIVRAAFSLVAGLASAAILSWSAPAAATESVAPAKPTIVLVHGAFAESSSWEDVVAHLLTKGYPVVAAANPLRGVSSDAAAIASLLDSIPGPVVLVGLSYGGPVISNAATGKANVKALVYVAAFESDAGESAAALLGKYPGSTLGAALQPPVPLRDGGRDLYVRQDAYREQFAADLPLHKTRVLAASQRPIAEGALIEPSGSPAWKGIPSWFIYGTRDNAIPVELHSFMAQRAGSRHTVAVEGGSHVVMASHPDQVVKLIVEAAGAGS